MSNQDTRFPEPPRTLSEEAFVQRYGGVYEHSPWIARETYRRGLGPEHDAAEGLSAAMAETVSQADRERLLALVRAHPDLAGKAAQRGELTAESTSEQAGAGIDQCTPEEFQRFQRLNGEYTQKFGFPFVMAVKGSNRHAILAAFEERLGNDAETELRQALSEIDKIARLRLQALASGG
jgi:OHCU decarboxylase